MACLHLPLTLSFLCFTVALELGMAPNLSAQTQPLPAPTVWTSFTPQRGRGIPDNRTGGATRSPGCVGDLPQAEKHFAALTPEQTETSLERPHFSVYIPRTIASKAFFSLRDANEDYFYQIEIPLPPGPGTYYLQLPADAPPLSLNKEYQWSLNLICGQTIHPSDPRVGGMVQFVQSNTPTMNQLPEAPGSITIGPN
jgi:hypothetical protein